MDLLEPAVRRIIAPNPGPMTGTGTNTYILGRGCVAVIDPGPDDPAHLAAIMAALAPTETVSHILVTHAHLDHTALVPCLARRTRAPVCAAGPQSTTVSQPGMHSGGEGRDLTFVPDVVLRDGDLLVEGDWQVQILHTPGHAADHLCFAMEDTLFSGDHVMGWSTSLVSPPDGDMAAYRASLMRLQTRNWAKAYPGHGEAVRDVAARVTFLLDHRRMREAAILSALGPHPTTLSALTATVYTDIAHALLPAAMRNVLAHALDLQSRNLVTVADATAPDPLLSHR